MSNSANFRPWAGRQRGALAFIAISLLLVVVALAIRFLLGASTTTTYDTAVATQSAEAFMLAVSGQERAVAGLKRVVPNTSGIFFDAQDCSTDGLLYTNSAGPYNIGGGTVEFTAITPAPNLCGSNSPQSCDTCKVQITGKVGSATRVINTELGFGNAAGVTGFGTLVVERLKATVAPSAAVFNLAYRRLMPGLGGGQATVTSCAPPCAVQWDIESSSGSNSVGSEAVYDTFSSVGTFTVTQNLSDARNFVEVGGLFEQKAGETLSYVGKYYRDTGGGGSNTISTFPGNDDSGETDNGAALNDSWCRGKGGGTPPSAPSADTLVFGISAKTDALGNTVSDVRFNGIPLGAVALQEMASYAGDMISQIWYRTNTDYTSLEGATSSAGSTTITVPAGSGVPPKGTLVTVKSGTGSFVPGTTAVIDSFPGSNQFTVSVAPNPPLSNNAVVCGGICAFFNHTTSNGGRTTFTLHKTDGVKQWAGGFVCLKGVGTGVHLPQGLVKSQIWYEAF